MHINLYQEEIFNRYKSNSQIIRVLSENWFSSEMYCPCCLNTKINTFPNNEKVRDFFCDSCKNDFQLKSSSKPFGRKVLDGEFNTMLSFVQSNKTPNFFLMHYSDDDWIIKNLYLIPKLFITTSSLEKRKPLSSTARRAGWIGCNILLNRISDAGRISIIRNEKILDREKINKIWKRTFFLNNKNSDFRGWTLDVLKCIDNLSKEIFTLQDMYGFINYLRKLHPNNNNIEAKIRQQLQILRDNNIITFDYEGCYKLNKL